MLAAKLRGSASVDGRRGADERRRRQAVHSRLSNLSGIERIVAFIGVGVLMLLMGYFVPLPPKPRARWPGAVDVNAHAAMDGSLPRGALACRRRAAAERRPTMRRRCS
jgi:hypothetical protein